MGSRKGAKLWLRLGDNADYEPYESVADAGEYVGQHTSDRDPAFRSMGLSLTGFEGENYISLFWGDNDAQPLPGVHSQLTGEEQKAFIYGLHEADGEEVSVPRGKFTTGQERWTCPGCGHTQPMTRTKCESCGHNRPTKPRFVGKTTPRKATSKPRLTR